MTAEALTALLTVAVLTRFRPGPPRRPLTVEPARVEPPRVTTSTASPAPTARRRIGLPFRRAGATGPDQLAVWLDSLADASRGGATLTAALRAVVPPSSVEPTRSAIVRLLDRGSSLGSIPLAGPPDVVLALTVIRTLGALGGNTSEPLDRAAAALRERAAEAAERRVHSAQARLSALVMTWLPVALLVVEIAAAPGIRAALTTPAGILAIAAGAVFQLVGWVWIRRLIGDRAAPPRTRRGRRRAALDALPDAGELIVLGVRAGLSPTAAVENAGELVAPVLRDVFGEVGHLLHRGHRLADALAVVPRRLGPEAGRFVDALATADRYGLPLGPVLDRLSVDIRTERRRIAERRARTLPVRLAFPLVACTLPAFTLLAVAPAVLAAVGSLRTSLP